MSIRIAAGTEKFFVDHSNRLAVQVQQASHQEVAAQALELAKLAIREELPTYEDAEVIRIPSGPFLHLEAGEHRRRRSVLDIVALNLRALGIEDAVITCLPTRGPLGDPAFGLFRIPRAVVCRLFPPSPETRDEKPPPVPAEWLRDAAAWLSEGLDDAYPLWGASRLVEFPVAAGDAFRFLELQRQDPRCDALAVAANPRPPDPPTEVPPPPPGTRSSPERIWNFWEKLVGRGLKGVALRPYVPHLVLAQGGPDATDEELLAVVERFRDFCRSRAQEVGYAFVDICPNFGGFAALNHPAEWSLIGGDPSRALNAICDEVVFDAFAYQVLGAGHLARLGAMPAGAVPLGGGRFELAVASPTGWLIDPSVPPNPNSPWFDLSHTRRDTTVAEQGRRLLDRCLVRRDEATSVKNARWERVQRRRLGLGALYEQLSDQTEDSR